jgi:hypothetical protein
MGAPHGIRRARQRLASERGAGNAAASEIVLLLVVLLLLLERRINFLEPLLVPCPIWSTFHTRSL